MYCASTVEQFRRWRVKKTRWKRLSRLSYPSLFSFSLSFLASLDPIMATVEKAATSVNVTERPLDKYETARSSTESPIEGKETTGSKVDDWYLWEVGGVILSAACIMAIVGLLIWLDKRRIPHWGFTTPEKTINGKIIPAKTVNISLNSVISWISTVGKIAILIPITKGLGQLKWVWFAEQERRLDDLEKFDSATRGLTGSAKLLWRLKGQ
jgi:hypothetical protein